MAVETDGTVLMNGEEPPGVPVRVIAQDHHLRLEADDEVWGEWSIHELRISSLNDGFAIRAAGENFILTADDDVGLAEEFELAAASPRLARKIAASHNTAERPRAPEPPPVRSNVAALAFALAGVLVLVGGVFLQAAADRLGLDQAGFPGGAKTGGGELWLGFVIGGIVMVAVGYLMTIGRRWPFVMALLVVGVVVIGVGLMMSSALTQADFVIAYAFIAGGLVVSIAVLFSSSLRPD